MKFTMTSRIGVTEVVDRPESARAALEQVLVLLGRKREGNLTRSRYHRLSVIQRFNVLRDRSQIRI
jgi:hypothetical protein